MTSSNFGQTIIGEATNAAAAKLVEDLEAHATKVPAKVVTIDALVADVSGNTLIINTGSRAGLKVGDTLQVKRTGREIKDPATGKVLRRIEEPLGDITITEVDEASAVGRYTGAGQPKVGDAVRRPAK